MKPIGLKRGLVIGLALLSLTLGLSACSNATEQPPGAEDASARFVSSYYEYDDMQAAAKMSVDPFRSRLESLMQGEPALSATAERPKMDTEFISAESVGMDGARTVWRITDPTGPSRLVTIDLVKSDAASSTEPDSGWRVSQVTEAGG